MTTIEGVAVKSIELYWPRIEHWVSECVRGAAHPWTSNDVFRRLDEQTMQLWVLWRDYNMIGCMVTEIYDTERGKTCAVPIVGGEAGKMDAESLAMLDTIEAWAREQGCKRLSGEGRLGWSRVLKPMGWHRVSEQFEKMLGA